MPNQTCTGRINSSPFSLPNRVRPGPVAQSSGVYGSLSMWAAWVPPNRTWPMILNWNPRHAEALKVTRNQDVIQSQRLGITKAPKPRRAPRDWRA